jgi:hypothetical protein
VRQGRYSVIGFLLRARGRCGGLSIGFLLRARGRCGGLSIGFLLRARGLSIAPPLIAHPTIIALSPSKSTRVLSPSHRQPGQVSPRFRQWLEAELFQGPSIISSFRLCLHQPVE